MSDIITITTDDGHVFSAALVLPRLPAPLPVVAHPGATLDR